MVADTEVGNPGAESADNSRPFVAEYNRRRDDPVTRNNVQIGVAHSRRRDGHFHLAGSRLRELNIGADGHRSGCLKQDRLQRRVPDRYRTDRLPGQRTAQCKKAECKKAECRKAEQGIRASAFDNGGGFCASQLYCKVTDRADLVNSRSEMIEVGRMPARAVLSATLRG